MIPGAAKLKLGATLAVPVEAKGASPAVLIIPGPGATNRDGPIVARPPDPLYKDLSGTLAGAGLVTLRYDHRGIGDSQMETGQQLSWDDMVEDAVDVWADSYRFTHGPVSSDAYRAMIDGLLTNGSLPARHVMRPEFQSLLPPNQDAFFKTMFSVDPPTRPRGSNSPCSWSPASAPRR